MWRDLLLMLSFRFFLFDFTLFGNLRAKLRKYYVFRKLFSCTFCQGFWMGLFIGVARNYEQPFIPMIIRILSLAFISAIVSFSWTVAFDPLITKFDCHNELPMTEVHKKPG